MEYLQRVHSGSDWANTKTQECNARAHSSVFTNEHSAQSAAHVTRLSVQSMKERMAPPSQYIMQSRASSASYRRGKPDKDLMLQYLLKWISQETPIYVVISQWQVRVLEGTKRFQENRVDPFQKTGAPKNWRESGRKLHMDDASEVEFMADIQQKANPIISNSPVGPRNGAIKYSI